MREKRWLPGSLAGRYWLRENRWLLGSLAKRCWLHIAGLLPSGFLGGAAQFVRAQISTGIWLSQSVPHLWLLQF